MTKRNKHNSKRRALLKVTLLAGMVGSNAFVPSHAKDPIYTSFMDNNAVSGYDVVSYFQDGKPVEGSSRYSTEYKGANWQFSSAENLALFEADPEKYAPQYGGYCAYAVALGSTVKGDPLQWHIKEDKLYLNINKGIKQKWLGDVDNYISKADGNWPKVIQ